ncbi:MAG: hypothetical protein ABJA20_09835, partial [Novosphingobium sp.]
MKFAKMALVAITILAYAHTASAKDRASAPIPVGSPGDWIGTGDYPSAALLFNMTGTTSFRLAVDMTGKP